MPIERVSDQGSTSLTEYYAELISIKEKSGSTDDIMLKAAKNMIRFIEMINDTFEETQLWGLTSVDRLIIQKEDNSESDCYVIIANEWDGSYAFQYSLPKHKRPWKNATVHGSAENLEEAKRFLIIAMNECEGWKENQELKELVKKLRA